MPNLVIAFDPGYTTGCCILRRFEHKKYTLVRSVDFTWDTRLDIHVLLGTIVWDLEAIVIETFRLSNNTELMNAQVYSEFPSVRVIGIIELSAYILGAHSRIIYQTPSLRKNVSVPKEDQEKLNKSRHSVDAYRHAKYYVLTHKR